MLLYWQEKHAGLCVSKIPEFSHTYLTNFIKKNNLHMRNEPEIEEVSKKY